VDDGEPFVQQLGQLLLLSLARDLHDATRVSSAQHVQDLSRLRAHLQHHTVTSVSTEQEGGREGRLPLGSLG
jgi:hypothetical protein